MKNKANRLAGLQKISKLRSDLEMRRFSAYRASVVSAQARIAVLERSLQELYQASQDFSISDARLMNALAGEKMRALQREGAQLRQMMPGYEAARQRAIQEFGRTEALRQIDRKMKEDERLIRQRQEL